MFTSLCIIDMQPYFKSSFGCLNSVLREIRLAKKRKAHIVVVEYDPHEIGQSHSEIFETIGKYKNISIVEKNQMDGSFEVTGALSLIRTKKIRMVGVNRCYCVESTAEGLRDFGFKVDVKDYATSCTCLTKCILKT
jgi:hypothetical protein